MLDEKVCPICKNHCNLAKPKCGRGRKYAETIELPSKSNEKDKKLEHNDKLEEYQKSNIDKKILMNLIDTKDIIRSISSGRVSQKKILIFLNEYGKITPKKLSKKLGIKLEAANEILSKMADNGLIKYKDSKKDKNTKEIKLTKEGKKEAALVGTKMEESNENMFSCLDTTEKEQFLSILQKLNLNWDSRYSVNN